MYRTSGATPLSVGTTWTKAIAFHGLARYLQVINDSAADVHVAFAEGDLASTPPSADMVFLVKANETLVHKGLFYGACWVKAASGTADNVRVSFADQP